MDFALEQYNAVEADGFVEVEIILSGGTSSTPITVTIIPTVKSPISATGKYLLHANYWICWLKESCAHIQGFWKLTTYGLIRNT